MSGRRTLRTLGLGAAAIAAAFVAGCGGSGGPGEPPTMRFVSRPDLRPPVVTVVKRTAAAAPGYVFIAPKQAAPQQGPEIVDDAGQPVWFSAREETTDLRVQQYRGRPVLTWWEGPVDAPILGTGRGSYVIVDTSYRVVARVQAGFGPNSGDLHEFQLTPRGTALLTAYRVVHRDTTRFGGRPNAPIADSMVQEVDVATGRVLFTWHSLGHVALNETYAAIPPNSGAGSQAPWDYFHVNSVEEEPDGNFLISARNTWGVYELDRKTGKVLWRLGGKKSDFAMGAGTRFAWQHDARRQADGTITIFDDESFPPEAPRSRAIRLRLDAKAHTATLLHADSLPGVLSGSQGNVQQLADGHVFVGWGATPRYTEFDASGRVVYDATFSGGDDSYRAYRFAWTGTPTWRPALAVEPGGGGRVVVHASWNGATEVDRWRVLAGSLPTSLSPAGSGPRAGFETAIVVRSDAPYFAVQALDASGRVLRRSAVVRRGGLAIG